MAALRCHLLIGPPASGKTTIAALLAPLLNAELFSTDRIREELCNDALNFSIKPPGDRNGEASTFLAEGGACLPYQSVLSSLRLMKEGDNQTSRFT